MIAKEQGLVLSIDQASVVAGVALWRDGTLIATADLKASRGDTMPARLRTQVDQLNDFLDANLGDGEEVSTTIFEGVRARLVLITVGAFLTCPRIVGPLSQSAHFVESSEWKNYAKLRGATQQFRDIKGIQALLDIGFPAKKRGVKGDDQADAVLIYLTWRDRE